MAEQKRFHDLVEVLMSICPKVEKHVLLTYVNRSKPPALDNNQWSLDHFLHEHSTHILKTSTGQNCKHIFFPGFATRTDINQWQEHMLRFLLKDICVKLPADVKRVVESIHIMRNRLFQRTTTELTESEFTILIDDVKEHFRTCFEYTNDNVTRTKISEEVYAIVKGKVCQTVTNPIVVLQEWHRLDKASQDRLQDVNQTELKQISERFDRIVSIQQEKEKRRQTQRKAERVMPPREPPLTKVVMLLENCPTGEEMSLSQLLAHFFKRNTSDEPSLAKLTLTQRDAIKRAAEKTAEQLETQCNWKLRDVREGCVEFHIQCATLTDLVNLFESCVAGRITEIFKPLQNEIRNIPGFENFSLEVVVFKEEYDRCIKILVDKLDTFAKEIEEEERINSVQPIRYRTISNVNTEDDAVIISVQSETVDDQKQLEKAIEDGYITNMFESLACTLRRALTTADAGQLLIQILTEADWRQGQEKQRVKIQTGQHTDPQTQPTPSKEYGIKEAEASDRRSTPKFVNDIEARFKDDEAHRIAITGLALVTDNRLVAVDIYNCCAKLVDIDNAKVVSKILFGDVKKPESHPWNVAKVNEEYVAVTLPTAGKVVFLAVSAAELTKDRELSVGENCRGIVYTKDDGVLMISYGSPLSTIRTLKMDGTILKTFDNQKKDGTKLFTEPWGIALDEKAKCVYVAETSKSSIIKLSTSGEILSVIKCSHVITSPRGIEIGPNGSVFIVGYIKDVICQMSADGSDVRVILDAKDGIEASHYTVYSHNNKKLYVTCRIEPKVKGEKQTAKIKVFEYNV